MSMHPSLRSGGSVRTKRNVLKRFERINQLMTEGRWEPGKPVFGIPKTKVSE